MKTTKYIFATLLMCCACLFASCSSDNDNDGNGNQGGKPSLTALYSAIDAKLNTIRANGVVWEATTDTSDGKFRTTGIARVVTVIIKDGTNMTIAELITQLKAHYKNDSLVRRIYPSDENTFVYIDCENRI